MPNGAECRTAPSARCQTARGARRRAVIGEDEEGHGLVARALCRQPPTDRRYRFCSLQRAVGCCASLGIPRRSAFGAVWVFALLLQSVLSLLPQVLLKQHWEKRTRSATRTSSRTRGTCSSGVTIPPMARSWTTGWARPGMPVRSPSPYTTAPAGRSPACRPLVRQASTVSSGMFGTHASPRDREAERVHPQARTSSRANTPCGSPWRASATIDPSMFVSWVK